VDTDSGEQPGVSAQKRLDGRRACFPKSKVQNEPTPHRPIHRASNPHVPRASAVHSPEIAEDFDVFREGVLVGGRGGSRDVCAVVAGRDLPYVLRRPFLGRSLVDIAATSLNFVLQSP
jgi:hypothetical protein